MTTRTEQPIAIEPTPDDTTLRVMLAEYAELKHEQCARIGFRDNLVYATLVGVATVLAFAISNDGSTIGLLVLPVGTFILGSMSVTNDAKISAIGDYVGEELRNRIVTLPGSMTHLLFAWETDRRNAPGRGRRKILQLVATMATFVAPGFVAIIGYIITSSAVAPLAWATIAVDGGMLIWLLVEIIQHADIRR